MRRHTPPKTFGGLQAGTIAGENNYGPTSRDTVSSLLHTAETGSGEQSLFKMPMAPEEGTGARVPHPGLLGEVSQWLCWEHFPEVMVTPDHHALLPLAHSHPGKGGQDWISFVKESGIVFMLHPVHHREWGEGEITKRESFETDDGLGTMTWQS